METAARLGIEGSTREALEAISRRIALEAGLKAKASAAGRALAEMSPAQAIAEITKSGVEGMLGTDAARTFYLWLALGQVPAAEARRWAAGIDPAVTSATLLDLAVNARRIGKQTGAHGITLETLAWAQRYLRGNLVRIGSLQFDLISFAGKIRAFRHRESRALSATTLDGRPIDLATGEISGSGPAAVRGADWEVALEPGVPVVEMHIPGDGFIDLAAIAHSVHKAFANFASSKPVASTGEAWLLDPQVATLMPRNGWILGLQRVVGLFPSMLPESATLRRLFGPNMSRAGLSALPRESLNLLQRRIVDHLAAPGAVLRARGGFIHPEELAGLIARLKT